MERNETKQKNYKKSDFWVNFFKQNEKKISLVYPQTQLDFLNFSFKPA